MTNPDPTPLPRRVLVTGAAGFIGSHVCERLASEGVAVIGLDNFDSYYSKSLKDENVRCLESRGADFRECDIRSYGDLASLIDVTRPEIVIHLAAKAGVRNSVRFPRQYVETNLLGTQNLLDACRGLGVERLVVASTSSVYGDTAPTPFEESYPAINLKHPYSASKRATELLAATYCSLYEMQVTVTRLFTVYGPRGRPDMMPRLLLNSLTNGSEIPLYGDDMRRDWTYIDDIVDGIVRASARPLGFEIINLGAGSPQSLRSFIEELQTVSGRVANLRIEPTPASEMEVTFADISKAEKLLDFKPTVSMNDGVRRLWDWWNRVERNA